jgi:hypothetical protein
MEQQTAVEQLEKTIQSMIEHGADLGEDYPALMVHIEQAKETEKQQHKYTWYDSRINSHISFEQYYTETYKSELQQTERERNKTLMILIDKLIGENDMETIKLLESLVDKDTPSMKKSFEIMTKNINLNK